MTAAEQAVIKEAVMAVRARVREHGRMLNSAGLREGFYLI